MKNKGFTLVEMLSAFILSSIIIIILFELIINLKEIYQTSGIKTELLNKQYLMTNKIYSDLNEKTVSNINPCYEQNKCVTFTYSDGTTKNLKIDEVNKTLSYDNYVIKLNNITNFGDIIINTSTLTEETNLLNIKVPIYNDLIKNTNFGINIVYKYNTQYTVNATNYNYKINGKTVASSNSAPTMEQPVTYTGLGETGNIYIKQGDITLGTINMQGHDPLMCIEGICDYIDYENNVIVRNIGKYVLTENENWQLRNSDATNGIYTYSIINRSCNINYKYYSDVKALNNYLEYSRTVTGVASMYSNSKKFALYYNNAMPNDRAIYLNTSFSTLDSFKSTLQSLSNNGEPMIIYYELAEPLYETIPLPSINTFTDITTLTITDGTTSSTIE